MPTLELPAASERKTDPVQTPGAFKVTLPDVVVVAAVAVHGDPAGGQSRIVAPVIGAAWPPGSDQETCLVAALAQAEFAVSVGGAAGAVLSVWIVIAEVLLWLSAESIAEPTISWVPSESRDVLTSVQAESTEPSWQGVRYE